MQLFKNYQPLIIKIVSGQFWKLIKTNYSMLGLFKFYLHSGKFEDFRFSEIHFGNNR